MTVEIEIGANLPSDQRLTLTDDEIIRHQPVKTHTGKGDFTATVKGNRSLEQYAQRQDRINITYSSGTEFTGYLIDVSHGNATTTIKGDGIEKRLEETRPDYGSIGGPVTYSQIALEDALRDYWPRTPFTNFTVTNQNTELVAENEQIQDADTNTEWSNISSLVGTDPIDIVNGEFTLLQSCWTQEGESPDTSSFASIEESTEYSGDGSSDGTGVAAALADTNEFIEFDFTTEHTIPEADLGLWFRAENTGGATPETTFYLDGTQYTYISGSTDIERLPLQWRDWSDGGPVGSGYSGGDLAPGTHTLRIEVTDGSFGGRTAVDLVAPADNRFSYNFDETPTTINGNNYMDGPELYPDSATLKLDTIKTSYNVTTADISSVWDDTSNNQSIAVTNDDGQSFVTGSNTQTLSANFSSAGRTVYVEFTLSRYGTRDNATPLEGFNGQAVDSYALEVDGNDLVVIDSLELSRNHFDNLQTLCNYGDFIYVIEHDSSSIGNLVVSCFQRGDETRPAPDGFDNPINKSPEIQAGTYYNSIYLEGVLQSDGTRPTAEVKDSDAISNDGREISPGVLRDQKVTTEAGATFRARSLLSTAQSNNDLVGSITVPPTITDPGYARPVDLGDGTQDKTVEEVSLTLGTNSAEATFDFTVREGFAEDISSLKRTARDVGDQV